MRRSAVVSAATHRGPATNPSDGDWLRGLPRCLSFFCGDWLRGPPRCLSPSCGDWLRGPPRCLSPSVGTGSEVLRGACPLLWGLAPRSSEVPVPFLWGLAPRSSEVPVPFPVSRSTPRDRFTALEAFSRNSRPCGSSCIPTRRASEGFSRNSRPCGSVPAYQPDAPARDFRVIAARAGQFLHTNPTRQRGIFNPFRIIIENPSLARRVGVSAAAPSLWETQNPTKSDSIS